MIAKKTSKITDDIVSEDQLLKYLKDEFGVAESSKIEKFISTGSTLLDYAIANKKDGGIPASRIIEIVGNEASGKSLLACHIMANAQKMGGFVCYLDVERASNKEFMERLGVDWNKLYRPKKTPTTIEEVFEFIEKVTILARTHVPDKSRPVVIVWDSVAATVGKDELETSHDEHPAMGLEARAMSRSLRKVINTLDSGYVTLICINQLREKMNAGFGETEVTPHGKALAFYASVRIKLKSLKQIKDAKTGRTLGVASQVKVFKNKIGPSHRSVNFPIYYDYGIGDEISWQDYLSECGVVGGSTWKTIEVEGEEFKWQGASGWLEIVQNPNVRKFVMDKINELMTIKFDRKLETLSIDTDSLLEMKQLKDDLEQK